MSLPSLSPHAPTFGGPFPSSCGTRLCNWPLLSPLWHQEGPRGMAHAQLCQGLKEPTPRELSLHV